MVDAAGVSLSARSSELTAPQQASQAGCVWDLRILEVL
jgi:hypothetical protein